ncbi:MAG: D-sedoheptulose 7-phosphate isomerase [Candidatus Omnitrophica bacterium]|nr:D-sedoheptulose 7-phosphate isomerase [Candidatus Omnitrophota bacterium]
MIKTIKELIKESIHVKELLLETQVHNIQKVANVIISSVKKGGKVIVFGNGGSAADSQHIVAELVGRFRKEKIPLPAIALTTNTSILTALANDYGYETVFSKQIEAIGSKKDVVIGISTSGKAKNVINAVVTARKLGIRTISFTGKKGIHFAKLTDISIVVPSENTARIQEAHITIGHIICQLIEEAFLKKQCILK